MDIVVRIKTGFFETMLFHIGAEVNKLLLIPVNMEGKGRIVIDERDILAVTLTERRFPELEIQTRTTVYSGVFEEGFRFEDAVTYFKENLNVNLTCEYKGGD